MSAADRELLMDASPAGIGIFALLARTRGPARMSLPPFRGDSTNSDEHIEGVGKTAHSLCNHWNAASVPELTAFAMKQEPFFRAEKQRVARRARARAESGAESHPDAGLLSRSRSTPVPTLCATYPALLVRLQLMRRSSWPLSRATGRDLLQVLAQRMPSICATLSLPC